jgi:serine/threonine protein phosphatase PrpC
VMSSAPDVCEHKLERASDTWLILACDGVWDVLSDQQVCDVVKHHASAKSAAEVSQGVPCQSTLRSRAHADPCCDQSKPF